MRGSKTKPGDAPPFELTLVESGPRVHAWLVARVGPDRADDVFQETMLAALASWQEARPSTVRAWLFTIARNKAIDDDRRKRRAPTPDAEPESWPAPEAAEGFEDPVWEEVRSLPAKQRTAVSLRFRGDLTHREIGAVMGVSEAAARRNVFEGLKRLRERIDDE